MSHEGVELVRRYYELLNEGDLEGCQRLLAPDFELTQAGLPDGGAFRGASGWRDWWERLGAAWSDFHWEPLDFVDAGDHVVVSARFIAKGAYTEIEQTVSRFHVFGVRDGRLVSSTGYARRAEALEAAGLPGS